MATQAVTSLRADVIINTKPARDSAKAFGVNLRQLRTSVRQLTTAEERYERELKNLQAAHKAQMVTTDDYFLIQKRLKAQLDKTTGSMKKQQDQGKKGVAFREQAAGMGRGALSRLPGGGLASGIAEVGGAAAVGGVAVAGLAGVGLALNRITQSSADAAISLGDTADKIGASAAGLRGLQEAGELTGVSAQTTSMALQRMRRRIAEAGQGSGEAQGALKELGLNAKELAALAPEQQFLRIAEAMKLVGNSGDQLRLSFKLFDSEGAALVNTLRMDQKELEKLQTAFADTYTDEAVRNARRLAEEQAAINRQYEIAAQETGNFLTPAKLGFLEGVNALLSGKELPDTSVGQAFWDTVAKTYMPLIAGPLGMFRNDRPDRQRFHDPIDRSGREEEARRREELLTRQSRAARDKRISESEAKARAGILAGTLRALQEAEQQRVQVAKDEIEARKKQLQEMEAEGRQRIAYEKKYNADFEKNLLARDSTQQERANMTVESISRERFGSLMFDTAKNEEMLANSQDALRQSIDALTESLKTPAPAVTSEQQQNLTTFGMLLGGSIGGL